MLRSAVARPVCVVPVVAQRRRSGAIDRRFVLEVTLSTRFHSEYGRIVTYLDRRAGASAVFRRALTLGPELDDPQTGDTWIPALRIDNVVTLVDPTSVIDMQPSCD